MWYVIIIFIVVFEIIATFAAPLFPNITAIDGVSLTANTTVNTSADLIATGSNPLETFANIMSFQMTGLEGLSIIFIFFNILLGLCIIKLIRGS